MMHITQTGEKPKFVPELIHKAGVVYVMSLESRECTEDYANADIRKQKDKMRRNGWRIGDVMTATFKAPRDVYVGNQVNKEYIFIQRVYCERDTDEWSKE